MKKGGGLFGKTGFWERRKGKERLIELEITEIHFIHV